MENIGWIKTHRKLLDWEWFKKPEMLSVFTYCLLSANIENYRFQGIEIKRGSFATSPESISNKTGVSYQSVRTCLKKLETTGEIIKKSTNKYTIITICKFDDYQPDKQTNNKQLTNKQQTINKQLTTIKEEEELKEGKEIKKDLDFSFIPELSENQKTVKNKFIEFIDFRKEIKKPIESQKSLVAIYEKLIKFSERSTKNAVKIIDNSISNQWQGLFELKEHEKENKIINDMPKSGIQRTCQ